MISVFWRPFQNLESLNVIGSYKDIANKMIKKKTNALIDKK